jgi:starch synthase
LYSGIREHSTSLQPTDIKLDLPLGVSRTKGGISTIEVAPRLTIYFVDQPGFYERPGLYQEAGKDYPDNAARFLFFAKAVVHLARHLPWKPELVHLHDWQAGFVAPLIRYEQEATGWEDPPRTCTTIHNLAYQGLFPRDRFTLSNLPWHYFTSSGIEFYGQMSCLKAGIAYVNALTTVSPRYAREITTEELGCGLDGLLRYRQSALTGILNGVDYEEWNTTNNPHLNHPYTAEDLSGKTANKLDLQEEFNLPADAKIPLFGSIGRLVDQKGVDIMLGALREMLRNGLQVVLLGSGAPEYEKGVAELAQQFPGKMAARIGFDQGLSHRIEAGSDFFLMPSKFEPCGLNQMYGLRYGTIPIVRMVGGLDDTVVDVAEDVATANGIKFSEYSSQALAKAIHKALALYQEPVALQHFRTNAMKADFSWDRTAAEYVKVYKRALAD